ncbi:MAG: hypothetical protein F4213_17745 [Boseongicola sp. SB0677_bin_26]|nr:hypothetical protein [Boseongicola sp. SB0665_bin_10]MYG27836.1 hypothetical protein [Boseongicola sp. SB0677_bin_26]
MTDNQRTMSPEEIADAAERLYEDKFRSHYESSHKGEFLAIDVFNEDAYFGKYPEDAMEEAERAVPEGTFFLVRIGEPAAFDVGYTCEQNDTVARPIRRYPYRDAGLQPA